MTLLPDSGEPRNLMAGTVLDSTTKPELLTQATWTYPHTNKLLFQGGDDVGGVLHSCQLPVASCE